MQPQNDGMCAACAHLAGVNEAMWHDVISNTVESCVNYSNLIGRLNTNETFAAHRPPKRR
jgi:hypothetical protein